MSLRIRTAKPTDVTELTQIAHAAKRSWGYPARLMRLWRADLTITPQFLAEHPVCCATQDRSLVGFCAISGQGATRELEHMWVAPAHQGVGVGRRLFAHLVRLLRRHRVERLVIASDPHAAEFCQRCGARRIGSVPHGRRAPQR
jgi:GNAT superfamily N-acetyltransferase